MQPRSPTGEPPVAPRIWMAGLLIASTLSQIDPDRTSPQILSAQPANDILVNMSRTAAPVRLPADCYTAGAPRGLHQTAPAGSDQSHVNGALAHRQRGFLDRLPTRRIG